MRADGQCLALPALARESLNPKMVAAVERILPPTTRRNVAVIGETNWASAPSPSIQSANRAIPFFGMLMGLTCIGHSVWVFDGAADAIQAGCRGADVLIVDGASVSTLPGDWQIQARTTMRNPKILVHDRATYTLQVPDHRS